jgi:cell wall-associated NlpC family hydrolase
LRLLPTLLAALALAATVEAALAVLPDPRLPQPVPESAPRAVVLGDVVHLYSKPTREADVVSQALLGWNVRVVEERDGFARVEGPDRYRGWIEKGEIAASDGYAIGGEIAEITSPMALLYREPDVTTFAPPLAAPFGARLELAKSEAEGYLVVRVPDGRELYLQAGDARVRDAAEPAPRVTGAELVTLARAFLDVPYLWGGMSARGIDCSGFVSVLYRFQGVEILRDADLQHEDPTWAPVERHELAPGDLLFFGSREAGKEKATHVGLYAGDGRFLSATTYARPMVREDRLDDPRWAALLLGARRPR